MAFWLLLLIWGKFSFDIFKLKTNYFAITKKIMTHAGEGKGIPHQ